MILRQLDAIEDQTLVKSLHKKMAPPLVTLLSAESEIQYVALRNINLIVQKSPQTLAHEVKVSRCHTGQKCAILHEKRAEGHLGYAGMCSCGDWTLSDHMSLLQLPSLPEQATEVPDDGTLSIAAVFIP